MKGGRTLIIGDSRAFFAIYSIVTAGGLRAFQLGKNGSVAAEDMRSQVIHAADIAECVLATYAQVQLRSFPLELFKSAIDYAPEACAEATEALIILTAAPEMRTVRFVIADCEDEAELAVTCDDKIIRNTGNPQLPSKTAASFSTQLQASPSPGNPATSQCNRFLAATHAVVS